MRELIRLLIRAYQLVISPWLGPRSHQQPDGA